MRVLLDTNVIVSALTYHGNENRVLQLGDDGWFELILSELIVNEARRVLLRKFGWLQADADETLSKLRDGAVIVDPPEFINVVPDNHPDNRVLECAVHASVDYLVTGDRKHLLPLGEFEGVKILRAPEFLALLDTD